jgi:peptidyl-prolyl cis-trans isomerase C
MSMTILLLAAALLGTGDDVVAVVDGRAITASAIAARQARVRAQGGALTAEEAVDRLVEDALLEAEARRQGLERTPSVLEAIDEDRRALAGERFLSLELGKIEPDEERLRRLFHGQADTVHVRLVATATRQEAQGVLDRLKGGASFAEEAKRSLDPKSKSTGGDLGFQMRMQLDPAFAEIAFGAPLRTPVGPVPLSMGFAAVEVLARTIGTDAEFQTTKAQLREFAVGEVRNQARRHYLDQLRARAGVELDETFLRATGTRIEATPEEERHVVATLGGRKLIYARIIPGLRKLARGQAGSHFSGFAVKAELAWSEVDHLLVEDEAVKRGVDRAPELAAALRDAEQWHLGVELTRRLRAVAPAPTAAEIEELYRARQRQLTRPGHRACSHVVTATRVEADAAAQRLRRGERFEDVARAVSADRTSAAAGGALGEIGDDRVEELFRSGPPDADLAASLRTAAPDVVTAPVQSRMGWHLLRCGPRQPAAPAPLAEVSAALAVELAARRGDEAVSRRLQELKSKAAIRVDRAAVARVAVRLAEK